jgi:hypothetical protein
VHFNLFSSATVYPRDNSGFQVYSVNEFTISIPTTYNCTDEATRNITEERELGDAAEHLKVGGEVGVKQELLMREAYRCLFARNVEPN